MAIVSYVHEVKTVYNVVQNPQMILLREKGAHGASARCEQICMLLPQRSQARILLACNASYDITALTPLVGALPALNQCWL